MGTTSVTITTCTVGYYVEVSIDDLPDFYLSCTSYDQVLKLLDKLLRDE